MLEVGGVVDPGREHGDHRPLVVARRERRKRVVELGRVVVDRQDGHRLEHLGEQALHELPVLEHVGHARRHAQVVLEDVDRAVLVAHQIGAADVRPDPKTGRDATALLPEILRPFQDLERKHPVLDDPLRVIQVVDEEVQGGQPLLEARLDALPFRARDHARHDVERPGSVDVRPVAVDGEGDAHGHDRGIDRVAPRRERARLERAEVLKQRPGGGSRTPVGRDQLVVGVVQEVVGGNEVHGLAPSMTMRQHDPCPGPGPTPCCPRVPRRPGPAPWSRCQAPGAHDPRGHAVNPRGQTPCG